VLPYEQCSGHCLGCWLDGSPNPLVECFHYQAVIRPRATGTGGLFSRISSALAVQMKGLGTAATPLYGDEVAGRKARR